MSNYFEEVRMLTLPKNENSGCIELEGLKDIPFEIKRVFYIYGKGNVGIVRGMHANRYSEFVLFNVKGSCKIRTIDGNRNETVYELDACSKALYLPRMVWKEMYDFSADSVLMVLTNEYYDVNEYIRSFEEFSAEEKRMAGEE